MPAVEEGPAAGLAIAVDIEIVPDDVDLLVRVPLRDGLEEVDEGGGGAALDDAAEDAARADLVRSEEIAGAVAPVLELAAQAAVDHHGAGREAPEQGLHRFLVDAEDDGAGRRLQVELANALHFAAELRIGAVQPLSNAMRPHPARGQSAPDRAATDGNSPAKQESVRQRLLGPDVAEW